MVMYDYDINKILTEPIKNRQASSIHNAFLKIHKFLKARGREPKFYIMYSECSSDLKEAMENYKIYFLLDPPHMHRQNEAEREIRTYKNHFISEFSMTYSDFSISEWDRLLYQCAITLNLLLNSSVNPALSAYTYLFRTYDFNKSPMEPPETRVIVHDKPGN